MSASIDQRIVSMKFDNQQFQNGVSDSLKSIDNLKKGLEFSGAGKGLDSIGESARRVNFDGLSNGLETVRLKFSALQIAAITALANITNSAINTGKQLISSLTTDPIRDGFREYETQMNAIQTILANTSTKGTTLDQVKKALAELNEYSDKTIYNFTEMTRNIGTFTAAGISLDKSTTAIKGIANLAAVSGSNSEQASTAMYQLSQALAAGKVGLQDWNSVVNAGMGGEVFKTALMDTARVHGVAIDKIIKDEGSFRESLQKGWITSEILTETLSKFTGDLTESQLKTMGYTDKQIAGIIKMGKTANDAATKVKTMSQLFDTLKEAVGSGWAQTWQTVFGDFEEAKTLFTNVSNVLGQVIGATSQARNSMLTGWKDLGGRTAFIDAIANAFNGLMGVIKSISGAFRDIFPATTSAQLFDLTNNLKKFTEHLKFSETTLSNLRSTFKGAFAILDIGKTLLLAVGNAISIVLGGTGSLISSILGVTGSFGEWITALDNTIKKSDVFNKVLTTLAYGIRNTLGVISSVFSAIVTGIEKVVNVISENISFPSLEGLYSVLGLVGKRMDSIGTGADNMAMAVGDAFIYMGKVISNSKIGELFTSIWNAVKMVTSAVGKLVDKLVTALSSSIENANFNSIWDSIAAISIGGMLLAFKKFMGSLKDAFGESTGFLSNVTGILDDVRGSFEAYQQNLKAGVLIKLGIAIALLAGSIVAISLIDSAKLASSLAAIGTLFAQLLVAMKLYTMIGEFKMSVIASSAVMLIMSTSILILSSAMNSLSKLDWNGLTKGVVGVASLAGILVGSAKILSSGSGAMIKGSAGLVVFAAAIKILASACVTLSSLNWADLTKGLIGVGVLMAEISLFLKTTTFSSKMILTAAGIVILSAAIKILASACSDFSKLSWGDISKGLVGVGALLSQITMFNKLNSSSKGIISTSIGLVIFATSIKILASAMSDFGNMSWESINKGLVVMAGALLEIAIAMELMPKNTAVIGSGLVIVAVAMNILASSLVKMGDMSWDSIAKGLVTMGGALGILAIGLHAMNGTLAGSAALIVAAGALAILVPTLVLLGAMTWTSIIKGLIDLAAVITIFGASALVLTPLVPSMLGLSAALVLLGISMIGIGAGLALVGIGLAGVATGLMALAGVSTATASAIVASLSIIVVGVAALIPAVMAKVAEGIAAFLKALSDSIPSILTSVTTIIKAIADCIVTNAPLIIQKLSELVLSMLKVISSNIGKFVSAGVDIVVGFINGISNNLNRVINAAFNLIITFINGLANAIRNNSGAISSACYNLVTAVAQAIGTFNGRMVDAGINVVEGFLRGLGSIPGRIWAAGARIGNAALEAAKSALGINSPSKEFAILGEFSGQGFINGLGGYAKKVGDASYGIGTKAIDSMSDAISGISDIVNGDIDSSPVIRPVLDLTDIQNGSNQIYSMMSELDNQSINGSIATINNSVRSIPNQILRNNNPNESINNQTNEPVRTQSNITPKQPITLQIMLSNGKAIAEYIIDDLDVLTGNKNILNGRMVGIG